VKSLVLSYDGAPNDANVLQH